MSSHPGRSNLPGHDAELPLRSPCSASAANSSSTRLASRLSAADTIPDTRHSSTLALQNIAGLEVEAVDIAVDLAPFVAELDIVALSGLSSWAV